MNADAFVGLLLLTNVLQFLFWARQNQRLVDRLMSRNYAEYVQTQALHENTEIKLRPDFLKPEEFDQAAEANKLFSL